jgi:DNA-binding transcriptional ArsR family regulator
LIKALAHPMRTRILGMLDERVASPRQLSDELGAPLQNVSYHVRELAKLGLIKLVRTSQRRGAIEHHYTAVAAPHVSDKTWRELPPIVRQRMTAAGLSEILTQVNDAAAGGGFVADDAHLSRTQLVLDEKGRDALNKELAATLARVDRIQEAARKRLGNDHASEDRMTLVMLRFDNVAVPKEEKPKPRRRTRSGHRRHTAAR